MRVGFLALILSCLPVSGWTVQTTAIKADSPKSYTVKEGDTLWGVAERFLESPWRWPELWHANPQTNNPHLIFPGDVVSLVEVDGQPRLAVSERGDTGRTVKLSPKIRTTPIDKAIPAIPLRKINTFMLESRIFSSKEELVRAPYIFASQNNRVASSPGDTVFARGRFPDYGGKYELLRRGKSIKDPATGQTLGVIGYKVGEASLSRLGEGVGTLKVISAKRPVKPGDRVISGDSFAPATMFYPKAPVEAVHGKVVSILNGDSKAGKHDTIIISIGNQESLRPGDVLAIQSNRKIRDRFSKQKVRLPPQDIGMAMIYRSFDKLSYGIVMSASQEIEIGDFLNNP
ncbi:LysM peptidoglycan-binding domain-containing protein [Endozoicomonas sp. Mp262]|uniref:LysM peptidoglycan-binding domain-containing protein n=1 Tax=Endozoicomonas sp. Mp262 TaxID=2919499 RepID=UPI0021DB29B5